MTLKEIIEDLDKQIAEIENDERLGYEKASIFENAPLAMVQLSLDTRLRALKEVREKLMEVKTSA